MPEMSYAVPPSLVELIAEIKNELVEFIQTRLRLAGSELAESATAAKKLVLMGGIAAVLLSIGLVWLLYALTAWIALAFTNPSVRWPAAFAIVGATLIAVAGLVLMLAANLRRTKTLFPRKTIEVLRADTELWNHRTVQL